MSDKWLAWASVPRDETPIIAMMDDGSVYTAYFESGVWWCTEMDGECFGDESGIAWIPFPEGKSDWLREVYQKGSRARAARRAKAGAE